MDLTLTLGIDCDLMCHVQSVTPVCIVDCCFTQARFQDPLWPEIQLLSVYIKEVVNALVDLHTQTPVSIVANHARTTSIVLAGFVLCSFGCSVAYFPAVIRSLNKSIKGNRALLLLLPNDVITAVPVLKDTVSTLTKRLT